MVPSRLLTPIALAYFSNTTQLIGICYTSKISLCFEEKIELGHLQWRKGCSVADSFGVCWCKSLCIDFTFITVGKFLQFFAECLPNPIPLWFFVLFLFSTGKQVREVYHQEVHTYSKKGLDCLERLIGGRGQGVWGINTMMWSNLGWTKSQLHFYV